MANPHSITPLRVCGKCGAEKPLADFPADPARLGGRRRTCKACKAERLRARRRAFVEAGAELIPSNPSAAYTRFDASMEVRPNGCWEWLGRRDDAGYGLFSVNGVDRAAHRFAYVRWKGPIPAGLTLDHLCRNHSCVNPEHLDPVTNGENIRRGEHRNQALRRENQCAEGHSLLDPANTIARKDGTRKCRTCANRRWREGYYRRKAERERS